MATLVSKHDVLATLGAAFGAASTHVLVLLEGVKRNLKVTEAALLHSLPAVILLEEREQDEER